MQQWAMQDLVWSWQSDQPAAGLLKKQQMQVFLALAPAWPPVAHLLKYRAPDAVTAMAGFVARNMATDM